MDRKILIIDLEATCWMDDTTKQRSEMEIIEIGSTILDPDLKIIDSSSIFVRPVKNPILSDFCKSLTSITQEDVDGANPFPQAFPEFLCGVKNVIGNDDMHSVIFASWGKWDKKQLNRECSYNQMNYPFCNHWNIKKAFSRKLEVKRQYGLKKAMAKLELEFEGTPHRGIDDTINTARVVQKHFGSSYVDYVGANYIGK
jgi:3'-5' exoribonuclease 1